MASSDLKGLGATEGPSVLYHWTPPNPLPRLLPWLATLVLLLLKPNRTAKAWWIWLPLAFFPAAQAVIGWFPDAVPFGALEGVGLIISSAAFGLAAVWLLAPLLTHRLRFLVSLKLLGAWAAASVFATLVRHDWHQPELVVPYLVSVGVGGLVITIGLSLAGLACRRTYRPIVLLLWLVLFTAACWLLVATPFAVITSVIGRGAPPWYAFPLISLVVAGFTVGLQLPFLVLAFANGFFRERLKELLHLGPAELPPVAAAPPPVLTPENPI